MRRTPNWWELGSDPWDGAWLLTHRTTPLPACMCYPADFSRSNGTSVITESRLKNLTCRVPPFKVTQRHRNRHGWINLTINVPYQRWTYVVPLPRQTAISVKNRKFSYPPCIINVSSPLRGFHWNWVSALGFENLHWYEADIFSRFRTAHECDRQRDIKTECHRWH